MLVLSSIYKDGFREYVKGKVVERKEVVEDKKNLNVDMIPEAKAAFESSNAVPVSTIFDLTV